MAGMKSLPLPEVLGLISRLPEKYQAICAIGVTTGCRISEILALRRFDLLDSHGRLKERIPFLKLKTKSLQQKHRFIAIPKPYQPFILQHLVNEEQKGYDRPDDLVFRGHNGKPMSRLTVYHMYRQYLGDGYGTHWMRKTFAQELFKYFIKKYRKDPMRALEITRQALGHARIDTTVKYLGITETDIETAQNSIFKI